MTGFVTNYHWNIITVHVYCDKSVTVPVYAMDVFLIQIIEPLQISFWKSGHPIETEGNTTLFHTRRSAFIQTSYQISLRTLNTCARNVDKMHTRVAYRWNVQSNVSWISKRLRFGRVPGISWGVEFHWFQKIIELFKEFLKHPVHVAEGVEYRAERA